MGASRSPDQKLRSSLSYCGACCRAGDPRRVAGGQLQVPARSQLSMQTSPAHCATPTLSSYNHRGPQLQPLQLANPAIAVPFDPDGSSSLTSLRRTDTFIPAELQTALGLKLPRVVALNPGYTAAIARHHWQPHA